MAKTIESVKEATGFDLTEVLKADTYDAKVNKHVDVKADTMSGFTLNNGSVDEVD